MVWVYVGALCLGMGALYWYLAQITRRQREVRAELLRLEQLTAQLTIQAEAVLDQADERIAKLEHLLSTEPKPARTGPMAEARGHAERVKQKQRVPETKPATPVVTPPYQELREQARRLAAEGLPPHQIAKELNIPRGEVELLLQLPNRL